MARPASLFFLFQLQSHAQSKWSSPILHQSLVEHALADGYAGNLVGQFLYDKVKSVFDKSNPRKDDLAIDSVVPLIHERLRQKVINYQQMMGLSARRRLGQKSMLF
jgi:hypothetical protein